MLSVGAMGGGQGDYYLALAREDYYLAGGEPPGHWHGRGAEELGLSGLVEKDALRSLLRGFSPDGERGLIQNAGAKDHQPGWDLTFSAPKSVSILWAVAEDPVRSAVQAAHAAAVRAGLDYLQDEASLTRRGRGGAIREPTGIVAALFEHGTSRALDPQLHTHALVLNVGTRWDGTTGTLLSKPFYEHKMAAGALYRAELGLQLQARLGLFLELSGHAFEVQGVPKELVRETSQRRAEIEAHMARRGTSGARAAEVAALSTRETKTDIPRSELFRGWREMGRAHSFGPEIIGTLCGKAPALAREQDRERALSQALQTLTAQESTFRGRDLTRRLAEGLQTCGWGAEGVRRAAGNALAQSPEIVSLGRGRDGGALYTTREMLQTEKRLLEVARASRSDESHVVKQRTLDGTLTRHPDLSEEQRGALEHLTRSPGSVQVVSGMAGTGKTTLLSAAREVWEGAGFQVYGAALAGKAAQGLQQEAGIQSATLAKWFQDRQAGLLDAAKHHGKQLLRAAAGRPTYRYSPLALNPRSVLVLDEAGMVGTRQMGWVMDEVQKAGAKLVLVGDARQLQPIEAGGPFKALAEALGHRELKEIRRQREEWARQAVRDFAAGKAREGLKAYAERGLLKVAETREAAMETLVKDWDEWRGRDTKGRPLAKPQDHLVLAGTHAETRELNARIQALRKEGGEMGSLWLSAPKPGEKETGIGRTLSELKPLWMKEEGERFYGGDRVLFRRNSRLYGVQNGSLGTIDSVNVLDRALTISLDTGERRTIPLNRYQDLSLGYAVTTHMAQGVTAEHVFVLGGGEMQDRELTYVQASRARGETRFYTERSDVGDTLTELARRMERSRQKELALVQAEQARMEPLATELPPASLREVPWPRLLEPERTLEPSREYDHGYGY